MPLKRQWVSGTRTKSGVLYWDTGLDAVMGSVWHFLCVVDVDLCVSLCVNLECVIKKKTTTLGRSVADAQSQEEKNVEKYHVCGLIDLTFYIGYVQKAGFSFLANIRWFYQLKGLLHMTDFVLTVTS